MALMMVDAAGGTATPTAVVAGEAVTAAVLVGDDPGWAVVVSVESSPTPFVLRLTVTLSPPTLGRLVFVLVPRGGG